MKQIKRDTPAIADRFISLHDKEITRIACGENSVVFYFDEGFTLVENGQAVSTKSGSVAFEGCNAEEFSCSIIKRKATRKGAKLYGTPISLAELGKMLSQKERSVEIYLELYDVNHTHWRGELCPYKKRGLSDCVVIEMMDFVPMRYCWEE